MTGLDLERHFREHGTWVDWSTTTDTCKAGDLSRPVRTVAVSWKASWWAMHEAVARGADLFVSHEPIGVCARNGSTSPDVATALPSEQLMFDWLREIGLTVYRCHDFWDAYPGEGVRDSWVRGLDLGGRVVADAYPYYVTEVEPLTVRQLARQLLARLRPLGQDVVLLAGDPERVVCRIGTGTGAITDPARMRELGADCGVIVEDFFAHVRMGSHARDLQFPMLMVSHGVAEEWAMPNLTAYLRRVFSSLTVFHIPQRCPYTAITG